MAGIGFLLERTIPTIGALIPNPRDQNLCAQSLNPMDMIVQGWSASLFQAWQQWSRMLA